MNEWEVICTMAGEETVTDSKTGHTHSRTKNKIKSINVSQKILNIIFRASAKVLIAYFTEFKSHISPSNHV
jgi:hypothetical protein